MNKIFSKEFVVKEVHLDTFGHVNNATYLTLFEDARWDLLNDNGYGVDIIKQSGLGPVILEITIKYLKELRLRENVTITTQCTSYNGRVGKIEQKMLIADALCTEAQFTFGLFSLKQRKIVQPTAEWLKAIGVRQ